MLCCVVLRWDVLGCECAYNFALATRTDLVSVKSVLVPMLESDDTRTDFVFWNLTGGKCMTS